MLVLSGKPVAQAIIDNLKGRIASLDVKPTMGLVYIGEDEASSFYIQNIVRQGTKLGCDIRHYNFPFFAGEEELLNCIKELNEDDEIHGIMIQKPLPKVIHEPLVNMTISPDKDIDAIHPLNLGNIFAEQQGFVPCTAQAVIEIMKYYQISPAHRHVVIVGRSLVVGKPLAGLLLNKSEYGNATVTVCHSRTQDIGKYTSQADIVITAIGKAGFLTADMIKQNAVCIDVGINAVYDENNNLSYTGDVDYASCSTKSAAITPVPGGVGSVTTALLLQNLVNAVPYSKNA